MPAIDNVTLITIQGLQAYRPDREEWTSFGELYSKWAAKAKQHRHEVFWLMGEERDAQNAVILAAIAHIWETHSPAVATWIMSYFREMQHPTLDGLSELGETCPDETILPLAPPEPVGDLLGIERLKEAVDSISNDRRA